MSNKKPAKSQEPTISEVESATPEAINVDGYKKTIDDQAAYIDELEQKLELILEENAAFKAELARVQTGVPPKIEVPKTPFTVDGVAYCFVGNKFRFKGEDITAADALADESILQHLVRTKSGLIKEI